MPTFFTRQPLQLAQQRADLFGLIHIGALGQVGLDRVDNEQLRLRRLNRLRQVRQGFWDDPANRHRYMHWLGKQLGFRRVEDWYQLSKQRMTEYYGGGLLAHFGDSPSAVLKDYRPDYGWLEWRFAHAPLGFWDEPVNRRRYMDWLGQQV